MNIVNMIIFLINIILIIGEFFKYMYSILNVDECFLKDRFNILYKMDDVV